MKLQTMNARFPLPAPQFSFAGFSWPRVVAMLPRGRDLPARLARRKSSCCGPHYHAPKPIAGNHPGKGFYLESDGAPGLRWQWCDDVASSIRHTGWFCDEYMIGDKIRGAVYRLPRGRGFLAGWSMGEGMAATVDGYIYDDEIGAAFAADSMAESVAEREREYQESEREEDAA